MIYQKAFSSVRIALFAVTAVCLLSSCQDDEFTQVAEDTNTEIAVAADDNVTSVTITGANTDFVSSVDCKTCTYVVDGNADVIDGLELGLKPGSVICLDAALKYRELTFTNLEGTEKEPIIVGKTTFPANQ